MTDPDALLDTAVAAVESGDRPAAARAAGRIRAAITVAPDTFTAGYLRSTLRYTSTFLRTSAPPQPWRGHPGHRTCGRRFPQHNPLVTKCHARRQSDNPPIEYKHRRGAAGAPTDPNHPATERENQ